MYYLYDNKTKVNRGWAATKNLTILFVIEDNNLSILTEKKVRRKAKLYVVSTENNYYGLLYI